MPISYAEKEKGIRTHGELEASCRCRSTGFEELLQFVE